MRPSAVASGFSRTNAHASAARATAAATARLTYTGAIARRYSADAKMSPVTSSPRSSRDGRPRQPAIAAVVRAVPASACSTEGSAPRVRHAARRSRRGRRARAARDRHARRRRRPRRSATPDARTSRTPSPVAALAAGTRTAARISSSASAVVMMPVKKCVGRDRALAARPQRDDASRRARRARSADRTPDRRARRCRRSCRGFARRDRRRSPPPRPAPAPTALDLGRARPARRASSARRCGACHRSARCRAARRMRPMSITAGGAASRSFSSGIRLWPPASSFAPGCCRQQPLRVGDGARAVVVEVRRVHAHAPFRRAWRATRAPASAAS